MTLYLTHDELHELTGLKYPARQVEWLRRNLWVFHIDAKGKPKVTRGVLDSF